MIKAEEQSYEVSENNEEDFFIGFTDEFQESEFFADYPQKYFINDNKIYYLAEGELHKFIVMVLNDILKKEIMRSNIQNLVPDKRPEASLVNEFNCHSHFNKVGDGGIRSIQFLQLKCQSTTKASTF